MYKVNVDEMRLIEMANRLAAKAIEIAKEHLAEGQKKPHLGVYRVVFSKAEPLTCAIKTRTAQRIVIAESSALAIQKVRPEIDSDLSFENVEEVCRVDAVDIPADWSL